MIFQEHMLFDHFLVFEYDAPHAMFE